MRRSIMVDKKDVKRREEIKVNWKGKKEEWIQAKMEGKGKKIEIKWGKK